MDAAEQIERLRQELQITRYQLCLAQAEAARYQSLLLSKAAEDGVEQRQLDVDEVRQTDWRCGSVSSSSLLEEKSGDTEEEEEFINVPRIRACRQSKHRSARHPCGKRVREEVVVYKFVPPLDFLPAVFVAEYRDVIEIIEKYAQLYHRFASARAPLASTRMSAETEG
ncbi:hypothetical protein DQ04_03031010 [Trypanosoma grayi]|uniref:hypothetical protein n=1 Tax=Trypanosoma grayi TaxID=71804 RepID=UPI0004F3F440|nr:hypothetical protein DQ04_03031010 [Trypanosoma grayi]KEG11043.1 hypothetical protein DQ04_03031010 [Trypanosoma grayi]